MTVSNSPVSPWNTRWTVKAMILSAIVLFVLLLHWLSRGKLLSPVNINFIISQAVYPTFLSWGMMFIFISGMIDLSIGANVLLACNVGAFMAGYLGWGYPGLIIGTVGSVILFELLTVQCFIGLKIPAWVAGLGIAYVYEAVLSTAVNNLSITKGTNFIPVDPYRAFGSMPLMGIIWGIGFAAAYFIYTHTTISYNLQAVGSNRNVASAMGINYKKTVILGAVLGSVFIAFGAIVNLSYVGKAYPAMGLSSLSSIFQPIVVVLLAKCIARFINIPLGILICSVLLTCLFDVLTLLGIPSGTWQSITLGAAVIVSGILVSMNVKEVVK
jgi:ribose transport system permease protein